MQFVLLVPGVSAVLAAKVRLLCLTWLDVPGMPAAGMILPLFALWLERALGILVLAPPLLVVVMPWLAHRVEGGPVSRTGPRLEQDKVPSGRRNFPRASVSGFAAHGDWIEVAGLALSASIVCLILSRLHGRDLMGWQLWGVQFLLIVWASLRQGLAGGTFTAAAATMVVLWSRQFWPVGGEDPYFRPLLQAHLVAQCSAALLVAASLSWWRLHETGYRQVVAHVPVVIYSARFPPGARGGKDAPGDPVAEVTLVSAACNQLFGCPAEQLVGDYGLWLARIHTDDRIVVLAALDQLQRQEQAVTCEYRLAPRQENVQNGSSTVSVMHPSSALQVRWLRDTLAPHRDHEGRLLGWDGVVTDITEQRRLADDLRRTTSMFHALVSNLPAGVFFVQGPHGQPILVNARARHLLGSREDLSAGLERLSEVYRLYRPDGTLYPAEELPVCLALKQGRTTMRDDIIVHRPDGRRIPLITWAAPVVLGQSGTRSATSCAVWVLEDLTALHQAQAARKDSEGRLRAILETMAEGLLVQDATGRIVHCNPAASAFFATPTEQMRGKALGELGWSYLREDSTQLPVGEHPSEQALRSGRPARHVVLGLARKEEGLERSGAGQVRWMMLHAMPLGRDGVVTTFTDIGAYLQAREAIRISEERYRGLVESLPLMLMQTDKHLRITYANPMTKTVSGYGLSEIADPAAWASVVHSDDLPRVQEMMRAALGGKADRGELRYRAKDGAEKVAFAFTQPRTQEGRWVGVTMLLLDVTRERQLEQELERARRLELIGRLSSGVAHDFNNLLGVVLNLTDLARGHLPSEHPVHEDLRRITEAGEQAAGLATQLLAFSKQKPQAARRMDLNQVARRTLELVCATLPATIRLEAELTDEETPVRADETQVQQVVMNLCLNARDAMPQGGTLRVVTTVLEEQVRLTVADTGQGMSEEVRGRIFEAFFSTKESGTGLGLAVVQQIVESYGGRITVESSPARGTCFDVRWPKA